MNLLRMSEPLTKLRAFRSRRRGELSSRFGVYART